MIRASGLRLVAIAAVVGGFSAVSVPNAFAADMAADVAPTASWDGAYVGVVGGYNWYKDRTTEYFTATGEDTGLVYDYSPDGWSGGVKAGINFQAGQFVYGLEADFEKTNIGGGFIDSGIGTGEDDVEWQSSIRARMGLAVDRFMVYGTGGVAFASIKNTYTYLPTMTDESFTNVATGYTVGLGVDMAITEHVIGGLEFRHTDFGSKSNVSEVAFPGLTGRQEPSSNTIRVSLSYKF